MNVVHSDQEFAASPPSLFLAGPTPRQAGVLSWRPGALALLARLGFAGTVLVPERRDWSARFDYLDQVEWEFVGLESASVVAFWVPRDLDSLPGFTTNVEFGRYVGSGRCVYGRPAHPLPRLALPQAHGPPAGGHPGGDTAGGGRGAVSRHHQRLGPSPAAGPGTPRLC